MKKILIFILLTTSCFGGWDVTKPSSSTSLRASNPEILANWVALEVALSQDHTFTTGTPDGKHTQITFTAPLGSPPGTVVETEGVLYLLDVGGTSELHFEDEDENTIQLTSKGNRIANNVNFSGTNNAGTGSVNIFSVNTSNEVVFPTISNFSVSPAFTLGIIANNSFLQGRNVTGDGNIDMFKITTTNVIETGVPVVLADTSQLKTSVAPIGDAQIANKKYVDDHGVVQVVNIQTGVAATGSTIIPNDDSIPQKTEGDQYMILAITPTSATNKLRIDVVINLANSSTAAFMVAGLFQDSTANALAVMHSEKNSVANSNVTISFTHFMTAGTTSSTTFKVRAGGGAGTTTFNGRSGSRLLGGRMASSITITEIKN